MPINGWHLETLWREFQSQRCQASRSRRYILFIFLKSPLGDTDSVGDVPCMIARWDMFPGEFANALVGNSRISGRVPHATLSPWFDVSVFLCGNGGLRDLREPL